MCAPASKHAEKLVVLKRLLLKEQASLVPSASERPSAYSKIRIFPMGLTHRKAGCRTWFHSPLRTAYTWNHRSLSKSDIPSLRVLSSGFFKKHLEGVLSTTENHQADVRLDLVPEDVCAQTLHAHPRVLKSSCLIQQRLRFQLSQSTTGCKGRLAHHVYKIAHRRRCLFHPKHRNGKEYCSKKKWCSLLL